MGSGFAPMVRGILRERSQGICEVQVACAGIAGVQLHHRRNRAMGGSSRPDTNLPANGLNVCVPCHIHIGANPAQAYEKGWLVRQSADPPQSLSSTATPGCGWTTSEISGRWKESLMADHISTKGIRK